VRATNVFYYLTYEGAVDLESTQEIPPCIFHRAKTTFPKLNQRRHSTMKLAYSIFGRFSGPESTFCTFSGRSRTFSNSLEVFKYGIYSSVGDPYILVRIRIISALFPFSQHLYEKREGSGAGS
jgi:hypothetical protein